MPTDTRTVRYHPSLPGVTGGSWIAYFADGSSSIDFGQKSEAEACYNFFSKAVDNVNRKP